MFNEVKWIGTVSIFLYFIVLCFIHERSVDMSEERSSAETEPDPKTNEDVRLYDDRERYRKDMIQEIIENKGKGSCVELRSLR